MALELYFYNECGFSQSVLNCMTNLHTVPVLVVEGKPLRGCDEINQFLVGKFL